MMCQVCNTNKATKEVTDYPSDPVDVDIMVCFDCFKEMEVKN